MARKRKRKGKKKTVREPVQAEVRGLAKLLSEHPAAVLDLHGLSAQAAERRVADFLISRARVARGQVVHIITGKGTGSGEAPVLLPLVRDMLEERLPSQVDEFAGLPGGGGWVVRLR